SKLTAPFIIGALLALIINPLVDFLQIKTKMSRGLSVFSSIVIILGVISTMITFLVYEFISGFTYLFIVVLDKFNQFMNLIVNFLQINTKSSLVLSVFLSFVIILCVISIMITLLVN